MAGAQDTSGMSHLACSFTNLPLSFPIITFFSPWARDRALRRDLDSRNVFPFSHDAPGGDMAISVPVREAVSASPMGWGRGLTVEMSLSISCCHTNRGRATNGLFFQSFLAAVFFFVCALSSIHLFMSPFSSPFFPFLPSLLPLFFLFLTVHPPPQIQFLPVSLSVYLSLWPCSSCTQLSWQRCRCLRGLSSTQEACPLKPTWAHTPHPATHTHRATRAATPRNQTRPRWGEKNSGGCESVCVCMLVCLILKMPVDLRVRAGSSNCGSQFIFKMSSKKVTQNDNRADKLD